MNKDAERPAVGQDELMRYIDGELSSERAIEVERAMESSTELRRDHMVYSRLKMDLRDLGEHMSTADDVWTGVNRKLTRPMGWVLFLIGAVTWTAYGTYSYLTGADELWAKLATAAIVIGLGLLLLSALVDRFRELKTDPYKEIQR